ncbi:MAG: hypothetical protein K0Q73_8053 [Paenibacillus sp.]|jgi:hypothetical protein|nr:hypothetical protein [Paenibacillus sp.]
MPLGGFLERAVAARLLEEIERFSRNKLDNPSEIYNI